MLAIPIDSVSVNSKSSPLFGNVKMFALYKPMEDKFIFIKNQASGNGIETAKLLKKWKVNSVVYSYMGDGPFKQLTEDKIDVYYLGKESLGLSEIIKKLHSNTFVKVNTNNASNYLDSGTASQNCECACSH